MCTYLRTIRVLELFAFTPRFRGVLVLRWLRGARRTTELVAPSQDKDETTTRRRRRSYCTRAKRTADDTLQPLTADTPTRRNQFFRRVANPLLLRHRFKWYRHRGERSDGPGIDERGRTVRGVMT